MKNLILALGVYSSVRCDGGGISGAIEKLNSQFKYLVTSVESSIDPVISSIKSDCESDRLQTQTYGWALLGGGTLDIATDWFGENRVPADILAENLIFPYGYSAGYGIGFGAPFLLPSFIGTCDFDCSAADFTAVLYQYGLQYGVQGQHIGESKLDNFGLDAKQALSCLVQQSGDSADAARIEYDIEDMVEAGKQILALQVTTRP